MFSGTLDEVASSVGDDVGRYERLTKIGAGIMRPGRSVAFQIAEIVAHRRLFGWALLGRYARAKRQPPSTQLLQDT